MDTAETSVVDVDRIFTALDAAHEDCPYEAIEAVRSVRDLIVPRLIQSIATAAETAARGESVDGNAPFYGFYLLAEFQAAEALPAILRAVSLPDEMPFEVFGDALTEALDRVLVSLSPEPFELLDSLIGQQSLNDYVRWAAASGLLYLVRDGRLSREAAVSSLQRHLRSAIDSQDCTLVTALVMTLSNLAPVEARDDIACAFQQGLIEEFMIRREEVDRSISDPGDWFNELTQRCRTLPIDTIRELQSFFRDPPQRTIDDIPSPHFDVPNDSPSGPARFVRISPRIGRNDPCSCGSGKKFKKCCLARH